MPYVFTDWENYTDPQGNPQTLSWDEGVMEGHFPGAHLECLRQAAVLRTQFWGIPSAPASDPGEFEVQPWIGGRASAIVNFVDMVAWAHTVVLDPAIRSQYEGWISPLVMGDFTGDDYTTIMATEADLLTAAGHVSRISKDTYWIGGIRGDYLRQLKDVLQAKVIVSREIGDFLNGPYFSRTGTGANFSAAVGSYNTASWVSSGSTGGINHRHTESAGTHTITRQRGDVIWTAPFSVSCAKVDLYFRLKRHDGSYTFDCPDHVGAVDTKLFRWKQQYNLGTTLTETLNDVDIVTLTFPGTAPRGWRLGGAGGIPTDLNDGCIAADYSTDWILA